MGIYLKERNSGLSVRLSIVIHTLVSGPDLSILLYLIDT